MYSKKFLLVAVFAVADARLLRGLAANEVDKIDNGVKDLDQRRGSGRPTVKIDTPLKFEESLVYAIGNTTCETKYDVNANIYGHTADYPNSPDYFDSRGENFPLAWISDNSVLNMILNNGTRGCCGADVTTKRQCMDQICVLNGIVHEGEQCTTKSSYMVYNKAPSESFNLKLTIPTWEEMIKTAFNEISLQTIFGTTKPSCSNLVVPNVPETLIHDLSSYVDVDGLDSWSKAVNDTKNSEMKKELNITDGETSAVIQEQASAELFLGLPNDWCTNPLAVRVYLGKFFDANQEFLGTGEGPDHVKEFITFPNPQLCSDGNSVHFCDDTENTAELVNIILASDESAPPAHWHAGPLARSDVTI